MENYLLRNNYKYFDLQENFSSTNDSGIFYIEKLEDWYVVKDRTNDWKNVTKIQFILAEPIWLSYIYLWPIEGDENIQFKIL